MRASRLSVLFIAVFLGGGAVAGDMRIEPFTFECAAQGGALPASALREIPGASFRDPDSGRQACQDAILDRISRCWATPEFEELSWDRNDGACRPPHAEQVHACVFHFRAEAARCSAGAVEIGKEDWRLLQKALAVRGFDPGPVDGVPGYRTRGAVIDWQEANGFRATGVPNGEQVRQLLAGHEGAAGKFFSDGCKLFNVEVGGYTNDFRECVYTGEGEWLGVCIDGKAEGRGMAAVQWECEGGESYSTWYEGEARHGRREGLGVTIDSAGMRIEGEWRDGKPWNAVGADWFGRAVRYVDGTLFWDP